MKSANFFSYPGCVLINSFLPALYGPAQQYQFPTRPEPQRRKNYHDRVIRANPDSIDSIMIPFGAQLSPARDYQVMKMKFEKDVVATIRLCDDCLRLRKATQGEQFLPLSTDHSSKN